MYIKNEIQYLPSCCLMWEKRFFSFYSILFYCEKGSKSIYSLEIFCCRNFSVVHFWRKEKNATRHEFCNWIKWLDVIYFIKKIISFSKDVLWMPLWIMWTKKGEQKIINLWLWWVFWMKLNSNSFPIFFTSPKESFLFIEESPKWFWSAENSYFNLLTTSHPLSHEPLYYYFPQLIHSSPFLFNGS
jgi:hypothetical protein